MVRLRLRRVGKKKQASFRLVAAESTSPRDGRFIENLGHYNPRTSPATIILKEERVLEWLKQGASPSEAVQKLLVKTGLWEKFRPQELPPVVAKLRAEGKPAAMPLPKAAPAAEKPAKTRAPRKSAKAEAPKPDAEAVKEATPAAEAVAENAAAEMPETASEKTAANAATVEAAGATK